MKIERRLNLNRLRAHGRFHAEQAETFCEVRRDRLPSVNRFFFVSIFCSFLFLPVAAQRVAILTPTNTDTSRGYAAVLKKNLANTLTVLDGSMSKSAFDAAAPATPFNLTTEESKNIGSMIGCDFFILLRSADQRRSSFERPVYYQAYAAIYLVSSRSGRLALWRLSSFEDDKPEKARERLTVAAKILADEIAHTVKATAKLELDPPPAANLEEVPEPDSQAAKNFRAPIPFSRVKPAYPATAAFYDIAATVDILVDMDAAGTILNTEIVRWAGFGLDDSVEKTVRAMNWRPAERNGKFLPMRFLLRYNFKRFDKDIDQ